MDQKKGDSRWPYQNVYSLTIWLVIVEGGKKDSARMEIFLCFVLFFIFIFIFWDIAGIKAGYEGLVAT